MTARNIAILEKPTALTLSPDWEALTAAIAERIESTERLASIMPALGREAVFGEPRRPQAAEVAVRTASREAIVRAVGALLDLIPREWWQDAGRPKSDEPARVANQQGHKPPHPDTVLAAISTYNWLLDRTDPELPQHSYICRVVDNAGDVTRLRLAFGWLKRQRLITQREGSTAGARSYRAIRIVATGQVFKTPGCPFDPPLLPRP